MDKRWIYIIIIFIIGCACLFIVAESSTTIGVANVNLGKFTISIPDSFNIDEDNAKFIRLINRNTGEKITIKDLGKDADINSSMQTELDKIKLNENISVIKETSYKYGNATLPGIYFELTDYSNNEYYFKKLNHTFSIELSGFKDNSTDHIDSIIDSLRRDPKQKQDE
ncbi:hypothetical protein [Methanobrevibacter sp.]|uniref:hypothetical protein n=1 Tax=Methanobrevibacter sp. TaxID=66852 RepID=UPI00388FC960